MSLLLGTHYHPGSSTGLRRQFQARRSLLALPGVCLVNLQFPDFVIEAEGFETVAELRNDSVKVTGCAGTRKPVGDEAFERLAQKAEERGCRYFAWVNADIRVTPAAVDQILSSGLEACVFTRMDVSGATGRVTRPFWGGQDLFAYRVDWWRRNRQRFRPYVNSEAFWDNVYTAITLCHADARLFNRSDALQHEEHPRAWEASPFAEHNSRLAARDGVYYRMWDRYEARVNELLSKGAYQGAEPALQKAVFHWPPPLGERLRQVLNTWRVAAGAGRA